MRRSLLALVATWLLALPAASAILDRPGISTPVFSPALGQSVTLTFALAKQAAVTVRVLDRDGVPVRILEDGTTLSAGSHRLIWDGRDDEGRIVPNEAWSFRIDVVARGESETYFPADKPAEMIQIRDVTYDRASAILRYTLPFASRVHLQAGVAVIDAATATSTGPVLKTVVNREPRAAGAVLEHWNGRDESGSITVPDLKNFVVAVATTPLPENSVITVGSRGVAFLEWVASRRGLSLLTPARGSHRHHQGLTSLEDVTPKLMLSVSKKASAYAIEGGVAGPAAESFARQGGEVMLFVDGALLVRRPARSSRFSLALPEDRLPAGAHILAVNWVTPNGPTAANAVRIAGGTHER